MQKWKKNQRRFYIQQQRKNLNPENLKHSKIIIIICHFFQSVSCHCQKIKNIWSNWVWLVIIIISQSVSVMMTGWLDRWWTLLDVKTTVVVVDVDIVTLWKKNFMLLHIINNMKQMLWMKQTARIHFHYFQKQQFFSIKNGHHRIKTKSCNVFNRIFSFLFNSSFVNLKFFSFLWWFSIQL